MQKNLYCDIVRYIYVQRAHSGSSSTLASGDAAPNSVLLGPMEIPVSDRGRKQLRCIIGYPAIRNP